MQGSISQQRLSSEFRAGFAQFAIVPGSDCPIFQTCPNPRARHGSKIRISSPRPSSVLRVCAQSCQIRTDSASTA